VDVNHTLHQSGGAVARGSGPAGAGRWLDRAFALLGQIADPRGKDRPPETEDDPLAPAFVHLGAMRLDQAEAIFRRHTGGRDRLRALEARRALGDIERMRGRYPAAARWLAGALRRAGELGSPVQLALTCNCLVMLSKYTARFAEGRVYWRRALRLAARFDPPEVELLAALHHNRGGLEFSGGRYAAGERYARRALALRRKLHGPRHTAVAEDRAVLAAILDGAGKKAEAEKLYRSVLPVFARAGMRYDVAVNLSNLGTLLEVRGRRTEAARMYRRAIRVQRALWGNEHPDLAITLHNLGMLYWRAGDPRRAESTLARAHTIFLGACGADHPSTRRCAKSLARVRS
jgi:tetratricopeptide (TPR) repeat protein